MSSKLLKISEVSEMLSVTQKTLRIWDKDESSLLHSIKTSGGHRRYLEDDVLKCMGICKQNDVMDRTSAIYARVSSNEQKQKGDLDRQALRLSEYCLKNDIKVDYIIKDVGSGLNDNRCGFVKLTELVIAGKLKSIIVEHKDRLTRFQFGFIAKMFKSYGGDVIVLNGVDVSDEKDLAQDIMSLLASFSGKYYGRRSAQRRKKNE